MKPIHPFVEGFLVVEGLGQFCAIGERRRDLSLDLVADFEYLLSNAAPFSFDGGVLVATAAGELAVEWVDDFEGIVEEDLLVYAHL